MDVQWEASRQRTPGETSCDTPVRRPRVGDLRDQFERLKAVAEVGVDSVIVTDTEGVIEYVNPVFEVLTGYGREEAIGRTPALIKSGLLGDNFYVALWAVLRAGREFRGHFINRKKNGDLFHEEKTIRPFVDADGLVRHFVSTGRDVTQRVEALLRLEHQASHDSLTGLPNRQLFMDRLGQAQSRAARHGTHFTLLCLDLDGFKAVNDTYGHAAGDRLLQAVAARLRQCIREEDTVARIGGDEFALILADIGRREDAEKVLDKILRAFRHDARFEESRIAIRASIGACIYPEHGESLECLLQRADMAMYGQKRASGAGYRFFDGEPESLWPCHARQLLLPF
ncbi:MAG: GGDEF domain-containing protein [Rhodocyclales bacterium]|nr:GGDEF domain-containing protein [Rhodocyclales bacterium]